MAISEINKIDLITLDQLGNVFLVIIVEHIIMDDIFFENIIEKTNMYLYYISDQLHTDYPKIGSQAKVYIQIDFMVEFKSERIISFLDDLSNNLRKIGHDLIINEMC